MAEQPIGGLEFEDAHAATEAAANRLTSAVTDLWTAYHAGDLPEAIRLRETVDKDLTVVRRGIAQIFAVNMQQIR